jgi:hypothetical protein
MKRVYLLILAMAALLMSSPAQAINDAACPELTINRELGNAAGIALTSGNGYSAIEVHQGGQEGGGALW